MSRETAYEWVQRNALIAWETKEDFKVLVQRDAEISKYLAEDEIHNLFDYTYHTKHVIDIFKRVGLA